MTGPRFTMDEDAARAWVVRAAARTADPSPKPPEGRGLPVIPADYGGEDDEGTWDTTYQLLLAAGRFGIILDAQCPPPADPFSQEGLTWLGRLEWSFEPWDGTSTGYRWLLEIPGAPFSAAGEYYELGILGMAEDAQGTRGAALAFEVLREAVLAGNLLDAALATHAALTVSARPARPGRPDWGEAGRLAAEVLARPDAAAALRYVLSIPVGGPSCGCGADHWECDYDPDEDQADDPEEDPN